MVSKCTGTLLLFPALKHICIYARKIGNRRLESTAASDQLKDDIASLFEKYRWMFLKSDVP